MSVFKRIALATLLAFVSDGDAFAASPPVGAMQTGKVVAVDGVATGTTRLSTMSTASMPNFATRAWVSTVGDWFVLGPGGGTPVTNVLVNSPDGRQWSRQGVANQTYLAAAFWAIDPVSGNDEAQCWGASQAAADAVACRTLAEVNRRVVGSSYDFTVVFHLLGDISSAAMSMLSNVKVKNVNGYPILRGTKTAINGSPIAVTGYATAVPSANTGYLVTASGVGSWSPYLGKLIENASGTKVGFVQSASGTTARLTGGVNVDTAGSYSVNPWAVADQLTAYSLTRVPFLPFGDGLLFWAVEYVMYGFGAHDGTFGFSSFGTSSPFIDRSIAEGSFSNGGKGASFAAVMFMPVGGIGGVGTEGNMRGHHGLFQACAIRGGQLEFGSSSLITPQNLGGVPAFDVEAGQIDLEGSNIIGASAASLAFFDCTTSGIQSTSGSSAADVVSHVVLQGASTNIYGSGNSSFILNLPIGTHTVHKAGLFATTSAAHPLNLALAAHDYADIPIADTATGSWLLDK